MRVIGAAATCSSRSIHPDEEAELAEPVGPEGRALACSLHCLFVGLADGDVSAQDHAAALGILAGPQLASMFGRFVHIGLEDPADDVEIGGERDDRTSDPRRPVESLGALRQGCLLYTSDAADE